MRAGVVLVGLLLVSACTAENNTNNDIFAGGPTLTDFDARERCLAETVYRLLGERGHDPVELESIATLATGTCSREVWSLMEQRAARQSGMGALNDEFQEERYDQLETERHARAVAEEEAKTCERK